MSENGGALLEECFLYSASNLPCDQKSCSSFVQIEGCSNANGDNRYMKKQLLARGPLITAMAVYDDDFVENYDSGVYQNSQYANYPANHQVVIVGYQDTKRTLLKPYDGYWICKNSWGKDWGETKNFKPNNGNNGGWFRIAYGECQIDSYSTQTTEYIDPNSPQPELQVSTSNLNFENREDTQTFTIKNSGDSNSKLFWFISRYSGLEWIESISPDSGVLEGGESVAVTVKIDYYNDLSGSLNVHVFRGRPNGDHTITIKSSKTKNVNFELEFLNKILANHPLLSQLINKFA
jgi:C1A family cysteine protease